MRALVAVEEERSADVGVVGRVDLLDDLRPGPGSVRLPEPVLAAIPQLEEQRAASVDEIVGVGAIGAGVEVVGQDPRSCLRPVGGPQLVAVGGVPPPEEERAARVGELCGINMLDEPRTALGPVRLPEPRSRVGDKRTEEERSADRREVAGLGPCGRVEVLDQPRAALGPVRPPQLVTTTEAVLAARKNAMPRKLVISSGTEPPLGPPPGLMSLTSLVPPSVPSDFQSSVP